MKTKIFTLALLTLLTIAGTNLSAQNKTYSEDYSGLNLGIGIGGNYGYYGYVGHTMPVFHLNYEFNVAQSFTLAPFISFSNYRNDYYWKNHNYYYHETIIPIGVKGTYYFDQLLKANPHWDFYLAGSLGFSVRRSYWDNGYEGDTNYYNDGNPLFLDLHIGAEYHLSNRVGMFLDLSTGVSTIGLAIH
jgi:hypothetical protein